jgi:Na+-driven multidrug efflux pump
MYQKMAQSSISLKKVSKDIKVYFSVMRVGFPSLIRQSLTALTSGILNNLTKTFGDAAIAAMSVVSRYAMFLMCVGLGMGQGFQPVASFNYRARKFDRVKKGLVFLMIFALIVIGGASTVSIFLAPQIVAIFQKAPEVIEVGTPALRNYAIGMIFMAFSVPVNMLYQSIQKPTVSSVLSMIRSGAITIPILLLGVPLFGLTAIQMAQPIADVIAGCVSVPFIIRFLRFGSEEKKG